jgi:predicted nucleotidyltransferase
MTRDEIITMIRKNAEAIKAEGVTKLAIFGSRVRGDNRADSDLDVLVEARRAGCSRRRNPPLYRRRTADLQSALRAINSAVASP